MKFRRNPVQIIFAVILAGLVVTAVACFGAQDGPPERYLTRTIEPCSKLAGYEDREIDPCDAVFDSHISGLAALAALGGGMDDESITLDEWISDGVVPAFVPHIVFRGTFLPHSTRCAVYGDVYQQFHEFESEIEYRALICHATARVNDYIVGTGGTGVHVGVGLLPYEKIWLPDETSDQFVKLAEGFQSRVASVIEGREFIVTMSPSFLVELEGWLATGSFRVVRGDGVDVYVKTPFTDSSDMLLSEFNRIVVDAHASLVAANDGRIGDEEHFPEFVTDTYELKEFFEQAGAYDHPDATPAPAPTFTAYVVE